MGMKQKLRINFSPALLSFFILFTSSISANAAVKFYENATYSPIIELIDSAKKSIDMEIYDMTDVSVDASIRNAVSRGVIVRVVHEPTPVGAACRVFNEPAATDEPKCAKAKNLLKVIRASGGTYVPFEKGLCGTPGTNCFQHGKLVIIDRHSALISTGNFNSSNLCNQAGAPSVCNRDYTLVDTDTNVVKTVISIFENDLKGKPYNIETILNQYGTAKDLSISPDSMEPIVKFIDSAKTKLVIQNQYLKDPTLNDAILRAAKRGVKVFIMVTSACAFGPPNPTAAAKWTNTFTSFDQAGITTRAYTRQMRINGMPGYLHAKAMIADQSRAYIGSVNGSTTSLTNNREFGVFTNDADVVSGLYQFMVNDLNHAKAVTWQDSLNCVNDNGTVATDIDPLLKH